MPRIWQPSLREREPCPPHAWQEEENPRLPWVLVCAKDHTHVWPDPDDRRD